MTHTKRAPRLRTLIAARIRIDDRSAECTIRNISEKGAKIDLNAPMLVPDRFELDLPERGQTFWARLAWRKGQELGVAISTQHESSWFARIKGMLATSR